MKEIVSYKQSSKHPRMKSALIVSLVLSVACAAPQLQKFKDLLSGLVGDEKAEEVGDKDYEGVPYTVIQKYEDFEERLYPSVKWACTEMTYERSDENDDNDESGSVWSVFNKMMEMMKKKNWKGKPSSTMFMKLFKYISGVNEQYEEIEMTVPVLTNMKLLEDNMINKEMCFYLEKKHQENPPTPIDKDITIENREEMTVLVHRFGGYAMEDDVWIKEAESFAEKLDKNDYGGSIDFSNFYTAGYDSPWKFWNRRNEVMYLVKTTNA